MNDNNTYIDVDMLNGDSLVPSSTNNRFNGNESEKDIKHAKKHMKKSIFDILDEEEDKAFKQSYQFRTNKLKDSLDSTNVVELNNQSQIVFFFPRF